MSTRDITVVTGFTIDCDRCGVTITAKAPTNRSTTTALRRFIREVIDQGWTFWAGRSLRTYCARCAPSRRSTMTNVTDSWANI